MPPKTRRRLSQPKTNIVIRLALRRANGHNSDIVNKHATESMLAHAEELVDHLGTGKRQIVAGPLAPERLAELAEEAAQCILVNDLSTGEELFEYLNGFLTDVLKEAMTIPRATPAAKKGTRARRR